MQPRWVLVIQSAREREGDSNQFVPRASRVALKGDASHLDQTLGRPQAPVVSQFEGTHPSGAEAQFLFEGLLYGL